MYDLLIVGAGLTAATIAARLKHQLRICVIDCRSHLGGNCFDYQSNGSFIHRYGPHIFHSPSSRITEFLEQFTQWIPYTHHVTAEIEDGGAFQYVPFPYCRLTADRLGRSLVNDEIIEKFYRGYSQKMWGMAWDQLPEFIRGRVPMNIEDRPAYYRDHFVALPRYGYSSMIENMFDGVELILGAPSREWINIQARNIVYTGRADLIPVPGQDICFGEFLGLQLEFRTLDICLARDSWQHDSACLHACTMQRRWTRKTRFAQLTGGNSELISTEYPLQALYSDISPYYPIETPENQLRHTQLCKEIYHHYPHIRLAGRLGSYRYFDMYQAIGHALKLSERLLVN